MQGWIPVRKGAAYVLFVQIRPWRPGFILPDIPSKPPGQRRGHARSSAEEKSFQTACCQSEPCSLTLKTSPL